MPVPDEQPPAFSRRRLLARSAGATCALAGVGVLAACGTDGPSAGATTPAPMVDSGSVYLDVATSERALIARYTETIATFPQLATHLEPLLRQHVEHLAATGVDAPNPPPQDSPRGLTAAITALRQAELTAAVERRKSCLLATEPEFVRTLTFIAASEASHIAALKAVSQGT